MDATTDENGVVRDDNMKEIREELMDVRRDYEHLSKEVAILSNTVHQFMNEMTDHNNQQQGRNRIAAAVTKERSNNAITNNDSEGGQQCMIASTSTNKEYENTIADIVGTKHVQQKKRKSKFIPIIDSIRGTILDVFKIIWMFGSGIFTRYNVMKKYVLPTLLIFFYCGGKLSYQSGVWVRGHNIVPGISGAGGVPRSPSSSKKMGDHQGSSSIYSQC